MFQVFQSTKIKGYGKGEAALEFGLQWINGMNKNILILLPIVLPILAGSFLFWLPALKKEKIRNWYVGGVVFFHLVLLSFILGQETGEVTLFRLAGQLPVFLKLDDLGKIFALLVSFVWVLVALYSFIYMKQEKKREQFFGFYLITLGILMGLDFSGNIVTMYLFYELVTVVTLPLIVHSRTKEAVFAGLKYFFYSFFGASLGLFGIFFFSQYVTTLNFVPGGTLDMVKVGDNIPLLLVIAFFMLVGFGAKAGMFPLQSWLPTAHPAAPAPASAIFSGIIAKSGIFALIRVVYYFIGASFIKNTWVQYTWIILSLITILIGSMLAYQEDAIKKRFAYSTVSQISYIILGLAVLNTEGMEGAVLHVIFHSFIKITLFLVAGIIIIQAGAVRVSQLRGIGKKMPITMWCYTLVSLGLIGVPFTSGFISKWHIAMGSLQSGIFILNWLGPVILLVSALLTAGYLLPITINGFFPGEEFNYGEVETKEPSFMMIIPIIIFTGLTIFFGIFPGMIIGVIEKLFL